MTYTPGMYLNKARTRLHTLIYGPPQQTPEQPPINEPNATGATGRGPGTVGGSHTYQYKKGY